MLDLCIKNLYNAYNNVECFCGVITINKRKFLTELGKLLTFMFEEDRQRALSVYESMFDETEDDTALMQFLGSPTKQAVTVARAYNAKERRLAVTSQAGEGNEDVVNDEEPGFVIAINRIRDAAVEQGIIPDIITRQYSVFEDQKAVPVEEEAPAESEEPEPVVQSEEMEEQSDEPVSEVFDQDEQEEEQSEEERAFEELPVFTLEETEEEATLLEETEEADAGDDSETEEFPEDAVTDFEEPEAEIQPEEKTADDDEQMEEIQEEYDNFQLDLGPIPEETRVQPEEIDEMMATFRGKEAPPVPVRPSSEQTTLTEFEEAPEEDATPWRQVSEDEVAPSGKLSIPRAILYLLVAVPLTTAGVLVLLIPTVLFLGLAVVAGVAAFRVATLAFNSFAVFADIVVVLGAALVLLALAIFLFWIFVSFIGGAIAGLINLAIRIGGKVCYREEKKA